MSPLDELRAALTAALTAGIDPCPTCGRGTPVSQKEVAEATGIAQSGLSRFLKGVGLNYEAGVALRRWLDTRSVRDDA